MILCVKTHIELHKNHLAKLHINSPNAALYITKKDIKYIT